MNEDNPIKPGTFGELMDKEQKKKDLENMIVYPILAMFIFLVLALMLGMTIVTWQDILNFGG